MAREAACVWLTGRTGAGKSTIALAVVDELRRRGLPAAVIDDPDVSTHLRADARMVAVAWLGRLLVTGGVLAVVAVDTPERSARDDVRADIPGFVEVFVDGGPGADGYEEPFAPELRVPTRDRDATASAAQVVSHLETLGVIPREPA